MSEEITARVSSLLWPINLAVSVAMIAQGSTLSADLDVSMIVRLVFGLLLTINIYFLRQVAKVFRDTVDTVRVHQEAIAQLQRIGEVVLADMIVETAGSPEIGRRKNDAMLRVLLTDLRSGQRRLGSGKFSSSPISED